MERLSAPERTRATVRLRTPRIGRKAVTAAFDGGRLASDGGVMLLSMAERR